MNKNLWVAQEGFVEGRAKEQRCWEGQENTEGNKDCFKVQI